MLFRMMISLAGEEVRLLCLERLGLFLLGTVLRSELGDGVGVSGEDLIEQLVEGLVLTLGGVVGGLQHLGAEVAGLLLDGLVEANLGLVEVTTGE